MQISSNASQEPAKLLWQSTANAASIRSTTGPAERTCSRTSSSGTAVLLSNASTACCAEEERPACSALDSGLAPVLAHVGPQRDPTRVGNTSRLTRVQRKASKMKDMILEELNMKRGIEMSCQKLDARICRNSAEDSVKFRHRRSRKRSQNRLGGARFWGGIPGILALAGIAIPATCILAFWHSGILAFWHILT
jgi:hypothetical protein